MSDASGGPESLTRAPAGRRRLRALARRAAHFARARGGGIAMMTALIVPALLGFAALAVDMGYAYWVRNELQITASAAALAGASQLPDRTNVVERAQEYAELNMSAARHGIVLRESDIELGFWDKDAKTFEPDLQPLNAVRVTTRRAQENDNELDLFLAPAVGLGTVDVTGVAIATFGAATAWDVVIVQDITDSFSGVDEFPNAQVADLQLLGCIRDNFLGSQVGMVAYTGFAHDLAELMAVQDETNVVELEDIIGELNTCGQPGAPPCSGTHVGAGIARAIELFNLPGYMPASNVVQQAMVIVGDGWPDTHADGPYFGSQSVCGHDCSRDDLRRLAQEQADIAAAQDISVYTVFYDEHDNNGQADFFESLVRGDGVFKRTPDPSDLDDLLFGICADRLDLRLVK